MVVGGGATIEYSRRGKCLGPPRQRHRSARVQARLLVDNRGSGADHPPAAAASWFMETDGVGGVRFFREESARAGFERKKFVRMRTAGRASQRTGWGQASAGIHVLGQWRAEEEETEPTRPHRETLVSRDKRSWEQKTAGERARLAPKAVGGPRRIPGHREHTTHPAADRRRSRPSHQRWRPGPAGCSTTRQTRRDDVGDSDIFRMG